MAGFFELTQRLASLFIEVSNAADNIKRLDASVSRHEADIANLRERVARLEESRNTIRAEVETELLKAVRQIERETERQLNELKRGIAKSALPKRAARRNK